MADAPVVHIGENSPQQVAYKLLETIAKLEKKELVSRPNADWSMADRKWLLDTYVECIEAVEGRRAIQR